jgi:hypothetical protein
MHGQGTLTSPDSGKYVGEWKNNKRHGQGTFTFPDGNKYVGEYRDNKMHGQGTFTLPDGNKYVGEFKDNNMHGQGTFTFPDGAKYVGEFKNGLATGGWLYLADGSKEWTLGNWVDQPERGKKAPATEGSHVTLRSSYKTLSVSQAQSMPNISIREKMSWGFYGHSTINHDYNLITIGGDKAVVDNTTGLMWHQSGSRKYMTCKKAKKWIKKLNKSGYAGYHDWRLPTVEEAVSLLESSKKNGDLYIDPIFSKKQRYIWTGDRMSGSEAAWYVYFSYGTVGWLYIDGFGYCVRPVRSVK